MTRRNTPTYSGKVIDDSTSLSLGDDRGKLTFPVPSGIEYYSIAEARKRRRRTTPAVPTSRLRMLILVVGADFETPDGIVVGLPTESEDQIGQWLSTVVLDATGRADLDIRFAYLSTSLSPAQQQILQETFDPTKDHYVMLGRLDADASDLVVDELLTRADAPDLGIPKG